MRSKLFHLIQEEVAIRERARKIWEANTPKKQPPRLPPPEGSKNAADCVAKVRELCFRHNLRAPAPIRKARGLTDAEIHGWKANEYVRWLLVGRPEGDGYRLTRKKENWYYIDKARSQRPLKTKSRYEAMKLRDELVAKGE
jgi:hypothetical protein